MTWNDAETALPFDKNNKSEADHTVLNGSDRLMRNIRNISVPEALSVADFQMM